MIKLFKARSLLYRRQILQENIRWKALDEIYKIYMLLHRSDLKISEKIRQTFSHFSANFFSNEIAIQTSIYLQIWLRYSRERATQSLPKNAKKFDEIFWKIEVWAVQKHVNLVDLVKSFPATSNEYLLAKFGVDAEENEPCKVCSFGWKIREMFDIEPFN